MTRLSEVSVVGAGIAGAATALALQRRGVQVTLIDAWEPGHPRAASAGDHRILRSSHGRDELYARWSREARLGWLRLAQEAGEELFVQAGCLILASEGHTEWEDASRDVLSRLGIPHFVADRDEVALRLPVIDPRGIAYGLWETEAGLLWARRGLRAMVAQFLREGGRLRRDRVRVDERERPMLDDRPVPGDAVVMACGAWMGGLFRRTLGRLTQVARQDVALVAPPPGDVRYDASQFPCWIDHGYPAYGIPSADGLGFKAVIVWRELSIDLDRDDRLVSPTAIARSERYLAHRFPGLVGRPVVGTEVGQIANTAGTHFIIDHHPEQERVWLVAGDSGHLFKHGPVLGEYVADLVQGKHATDERFCLARTGAAALADRPQ